MTDNQIITEISDCFVEITRDENGFFVANWSPEIQTYKTIDELYSDFLPILKEAQKVGGEWQEEIDYIENAPAERWPHYMLSRNGGKLGTIVNPNSRPCPMEGCNGVRMHVLWGNGRSTYPCSKGCNCIAPRTWQIG